MPAQGDASSHVASHRFLQRAQCVQYQKALIKAMLSFKTTVAFIAAAVWCVAPEPCHSM